MRIYNPRTADAWKVQVAANAHGAIGRPMQHAVRVAIWFHLERPASHRTKGTALRQAAPKHHRQKPDLDNLAKAVLDALNGIAYEDDSQVSELQLGKAWAVDRPMCVITVEEIHAA